MILKEPLFYIYLIYGLSFLFMSYIVAHAIRNASAISLVSTFHVLSLFGLTHGVAELVDWARFILKHGGHGDITALQYLSQALAGISFVILMQFGVNLLSYKSSSRQMTRLIPAICVAIYVLALVLMKVGEVSQASLLARRGFGVSGSILTGLALFTLANAMKSLGNVRIVTGLTITAIGFFCYAIFGGIIITPIAGLPIQLFRSACAIVIATGSVSILEVFRAAVQEARSSQGLDRELPVRA
jgi:hypothetical protein